MKPLNLDNKPCSPISSNCVVWQGPDIPCIELCTGDTVSDVVSQMATELCTILDTLKVSNYDLTCFNIQACGPQDFQALIQFLIDKVCEAEGITPTTKDEPTCPDCVVSVAECFVTGTQTTMQLVDYVQLIGQRICSIITEISLIQDQITDILIRLTTLENTAPPTLTLPPVNITCASFPLSGPQQMNDILDVFINTVWCDFYAAVGSAADILDVISKACITEGSLTISDPTTTYGVAYAGQWINSPLSTLSDAVNNLWLVICDIHSALLSFGITIQDEGSNLPQRDIINFTGVGVTATDDPGNSRTNVNIPGITDTGWVNLDGFSWYGNDMDSRKPQCRRIGNVIHFRGIVMIPLQDPANGNQPLVWNYKSSAPDEDTYFGNTTVTPSQSGPEGVQLLAGGGVRFYSGNSVIPDSVVDSGTNFDNEYSLPFALGKRFIEIEAATPKSGMLNTLLKPIISADKTLKLLLIKDFEESAGSEATGIAVPYSTSIANNLISHVRATDHIPLYQNVGSTMANNSATGVQNVTLDYDATLTYPFSCDANNEAEVGGFGWVYLDGLMAYLEP